MLRAAETGNEELMLQLLYRMITIHTNVSARALYYSRIMTVTR